MRLDYKLNQQCEAQNFISSLKVSDFLESLDKPGRMKMQHGVFDTVSLSQVHQVFSPRVYVHIILTGLLGVLASVNPFQHLYGFIFFIFARLREWHLRSINL